MNLHQPLRLKPESAPHRRVTMLKVLLLFILLIAGIVLG